MKYWKIPALLNAEVTLIITSRKIKLWVWLTLQPLRHAIIKGLVLLTTAKVFMYLSLRAGFIQCF